METDMGNASRGVFPFALGRRPSPKDERTLKMAEFLNLSVLPEVPAAFDWTMRDGIELDYPMLGNDRYGDCVFASACHEIITWTGQTGVQQVISEEEALAAYSAFTGFDRNRPETDRGADMLTTAKRWRTTPIAGRTIKAFGVVDPTRPDLIAACANLFGGLWTGWSLPVAWQNLDIWDVSPTGSKEGNWAPYSCSASSLQSCSG